MQNRKRPNPQNSLPDSAPPNEVRLRPSKEVALVYKDLPRKPADDKRIHQRRVLPPIPEAADDIVETGPDKDKDPPRPGERKR
jgi:hypothetical protein